MTQAIRLSTRWVVGFLTVLTLVTGFAGCMSAPTPRLAVSALEGLRIIEDELGLQPLAAVLMAIAGHEIQQTSPDPNVTARSTSWTYHFYDAQLHEVRTIVLDSWGTLQGDTTRRAAGRFSGVAPPITALPIDSSQVSQLVAAAAGAPPPGTRTTYSLETLSGVPIWSVHHAPPGVAASTFAFNGNTGAAVSIASLPHLQGLAFATARQAAEGAMLVAASDAFLFEAATFETKAVGATEHMLFTSGSSFDRGFVPTGDVAPLDGLVSWWALLYYSPSQHQVWPVFVYSNLVPLVGDPLPATRPARVYAEFPDNLHDPVDMVPRILHEKQWASYHLMWGNSRPLWEFLYDFQHRTVFDAATGETLSCNYCQP